jgi:hypothetical protein
MIAPEVHMQAAHTLSVIVQPGTAPAADWWTQLLALLQHKVSWWTQLLALLQHKFSAHLHVLMD